MAPRLNGDLIYLLNILEYLGRIWNNSKDFTNADDFYQNDGFRNFDASLLLFNNISENITKLTSNIKEDYPEIPWQQIRDFRNRIVHDYGKLDIYTVWEIVTNDMRVLKVQIENIIKERLAKNILDIEALERAKLSTEYKSVNFYRLI